jgi:hypothetical protein
MAPVQKSSAACWSLTGTMTFRTPVITISLPIFEGATVLDISKMVLSEMDCNMAT